MALPRDLVSQFEKLVDERVRRALMGSAFTNSGLTVTGPQQFEIDGTVTVTGDFIAEGKIDNDALVSPTAPGVIFDYIEGFALTATLTNIRTTTITVPAGFTKAAVSITARVFAINPRTSGGYDGNGGDYLYCQANIAGLNGFSLPLAVPGNGGSGINVSPFSTVLPGLTPGGTFTVQIAASTNFANWAANALNVAEVSGSVTWFRA